MITEGMSGPHTHRRDRNEQREAAMPARVDLFLNRLSRRALTATVMACALALAIPAHAEIKSLEIIAPANPGGGWDQTARAIQAALQEDGIASGVQVAEHRRRRRHDRACPVRHQQEEEGRRDPGRRAGDGRRHPDQQGAGHARRRDAAGAADRRVRADRRPGRLAVQDDGRPGREAEGRPGLGVAGAAARPVAPTISWRR